MQDQLPQLIRLPELCQRIQRSRNGVLCLEKTDPTFPRRIKMGEGRTAPVYYDMAEVRAWLDAKKEARI